MDSEEVYLTIYINYNGKEFSDKTTCLPSLEEIKNKSKIEFNISEEDLKNIKFRYQNEKNEFLDIKKDLDLIFNAKENNEYDFEIKLDIIIDTPINSLGYHEVTVQLHKKVVAKVTVHLEK